MHLNKPLNDPALTTWQVEHLMILWAALYITETWTAVAQAGGNRSLYAKARQAVMFDRVLNKQIMGTDNVRTEIS